MNAEYIRPLLDARASLAMVGGKGAALARLTAAGLPVPEGFCLTTAAYDRFVAENGLRPRIAAALTSADVDRPQTLESVAGAIAALFADGQMPAEVAAAIAMAYAGLPGSNPAVAVRSSATAEDLPELSFAGQQETYLNVAGAGPVLAAVKRCWASLWTARAIGYRLRHTIDQGAVSLAVVVQLLVPAEAAGILFTANPITGDREEMVASAAWGLGEAVVGGLVTPDTVTVQRHTGRVVARHIADKESMTVRVDGGTQEQPVPSELRRAPVLSDQAASDLARLGTQIEDLYGQPMDIEWALRDGQFAIVQARPITALPEPVSITHPEWALPEPKGRYMRGSIVDLMPSPLSPLFATLGIEAINTGIQRLMVDYFGATRFVLKELMVTINHYAYMKVSYTPREWWGMLTVMLPKFPHLARTGTRWWQDTMRPAYVQAIARWQERCPSDMTPTQLLAGVSQILDATVDHLGSLMVGTMGVSAGSEGLFTRVYEKMVRREGEPAAPTFLMGYNTTPIRAEKSLFELAEWCRQHPDLAGHVSRRPSKQLAADLVEDESPREVEGQVWRAWRERFQRHLQQFGHIIYDMDFATQLPLDDPAPMIETCKMYLRGEGANPHDRQQATAERREQATQAVMNRLKGLRLWAFRKSLRWAQSLAQVREDGIADIGLSYPVLRQMLLELGRRFTWAGIVEEPSDMFWLTKTEVEQAAAALEEGATTSGLSAEVRERRAEREALRRVTPPPMLPPAKRYMGVNIESFVAPGEEDQRGRTVKGLGASPGRVRGKARVLHGPEEFGQMQPGEVLVAGITTPAWTPLFAMASAVVTDVGGPLSHGSIVAREYGIPAVLGTGVATRRILSGQTITVDGSAGEVILEERG